jgi:tRNA threonylcarbamoyladenosine modification (KEOPS) complex  Pcc1 subunit
MNITIEIYTPDAEIVSQALRAEIESSPYTKSETSVQVADSAVTISIRTNDIRALRGTFNSVMNWVLTALESLSLV